MKKQVKTTARVKGTRAAGSKAGSRTATATATARTPVRKKGTVKGGSKVRNGTGTLAIPVKDLVGLYEVAEKAGVLPSAVMNWRSRFRGEFPKPVKQLAMGPVWDWTDIHAWLKETGRA